MKISELVAILNKTKDTAGDLVVRIETSTKDKVRVEQDIFDVLIGGNRVILVSKEALEADPLLDLPTMPNLSSVTIGGLPQ